MGGVDDSSDEDEEGLPVRERDTSEEHPVLYMSSDEGEMEHDAASSSAFASASPRGTSPVAPVSPHAPRPGRKISLRHSLVKGMLAHGRTDPGYNACLYSRSHTQDLLDVVACKACGGGLTITRHGSGFAQFDKWSCRTCGVIMATKHPKASGSSIPNLSSVYASLVNDDGYNGYIWYCGALHVPALSKFAYYHHAQILFERMEAHYAESMNIVFQTVRQYYQDEIGVFPVDNIIPVEVSYDGTYAKRGFKSLYAMGYLVEVYTGYVIDMLVIGKCRLCPRVSRGMEVCPHGDYIGSSGGMEVQIARILWGRSRDLGFEYRVMVADGDAATFNAVRDTYGPDSVVKEMCANHVGKRMKTRLLKLVSTFTQNTTFMSGRRRGQVRKTYPLKKLLTEAMMTRLSNYYISAIHSSIRAGVGEMQSRILATFHHLSAHIFSPHHHDLCPPGEGSWCKYQKAVARGVDPTTAIQEPGIFSTFPRDARTEVEKIYTDLSDPTLLMKCQKGHTQNINESLHSKLWSKVAKHKFHGLDRIMFLARVTSLEHNFGSEEGSLLRTLSVDTSVECLRVLQEQDRESFRVASRNPRQHQPPEEAEDAGPDYAAGQYE